MDSPTKASERVGRSGDVGRASDLFLGTPSTRSRSRSLIGRGVDGVDDDDDAPPIPFNRPPFFREDFDAAITDASTYGQFSGDGINTRKCVEMLDSAFGYARSLLTPSCTAALEMAALILDVGPEDEVVVPSFTFVTSASAFALRGARLVFADSESTCPNVDVHDIVARVTPRTRAIVVVHYAGVAVDVARLLELTGGSVPVVEDCAHSITSTDPRTGDYLGKAGCMSCFSFHETKNVPIGEGGLLVVNDERMWRRAQIVREKGTNRTDFKAGRASFYTWVDLGSSYLMSEVDAAILRSALKNVDALQRRRLEVWDAYDARIDASSPDAPFVKPDRSQRANAHMYYLTFHDTNVRTHFCSHMKGKKIVVATHYMPLDSSPFVRERSDGNAPPCEQAARWSARLVRLPLFFGLSDDQLDRVVRAVHDFAPISLHPADERYWEDIRRIRNDNRECFTQTAVIPREDHWNFMGRHAGTYRVAIRRGEVLGFIGHVKRDARLATNAKGDGVARFMWDAFVEEVGELDVQVLPNNPRSIGFFRKLGYVPTAELSGSEPVPLARRN